MEKQTIRDIDVKGKRILVRVDFNVPMDEKTGAITDDTRIRAVLPTIKYLIDNKAKVILCSHLGDPGGKVDEKLRLAPVAKRLSELTNIKVKYTHDCVGLEVSTIAKELEQGEILLLENLRFNPGETRNDSKFAQELASLADIFVNDAFGTSHRSHASVVGVAAYLPAVAGFLVEKEVNMLGKVLLKPSRPVTAIMGGAKVSDKIKLISKLLEMVDNVLIGGGMAATFIKSMNYGIGKSLVENDRITTAKELIEKAKIKGCKLVLPVDVTVGDSFSPDATAKVVAISAIPDNSLIMDIGPKTISLFEDIISKSNTVIWNGPMGVFEYKKFSTGTSEIADKLSMSKATTIIGGGSTAEVVESMGLASKMTHVSTGGGASLKFIEEGTLPGMDWKKFKNCL
ncbi:MAG: phosphoglycerate kinase [Chloroflexi bacterium]|nr:phosphoglycerate kinase [Chloroflexota bacterium]